MSKKSFELGRELARVMQKEAGLGETIGRGVDSAVGYGANAIGTGARTVAGFSAPGMMLQAPGRIAGAVNTAAQAGRSLGSGIARMGFGAHNAAQSYLRSATQPQPARTPARTPAKPPMMAAVQAPRGELTPQPSKMDIPPRHGNRVLQNPSVPSSPMAQLPATGSRTAAGVTGYPAPPVPRSAIGRSDVASPPRSYQPAPSPQPASQAARPSPYGRNPMMQPTSMQPDMSQIPAELMQRYHANRAAGRTNMSPAEALGYYNQMYGGVGTTNLGMQGKGVKAASDTSDVLSTGFGAGIGGLGAYGLVRPDSMADSIYNTARHGTPDSIAGLAHMTSNLFGNNPAGLRTNMLTPAFHKLYNTVAKSGRGAGAMDTLAMILLGMTQHPRKHPYLIGAGAIGGGLAGLSGSQLLSSLQGPRARAAI